MYPVIRIFKNSELGSSNTITVKNHTTDAELVIEKNMHFGEEIVIDTLNRTVLSNEDRW